MCVSRHSVSRAEPPLSWTLSAEGTEGDQSGCFIRCGAFFESDRKRPGVRHLPVQAIGVAARMRGFRAAFSGFGPMPFMNSVRSRSLESAHEHATSRPPAPVFAPVRCGSECRSLTCTDAPGSPPGHPICHHRRKWPEMLEFTGKNQRLRSESRWVSSGLRLNS